MSNDTANDIFKREHKKFTETSGARIVLDCFGVNNVEESGAITYVGKEDREGNWLVQKIDETTGTSISYATIQNNPTITSYSNAWTNRATLTYGEYSESF